VAGFADHRDLELSLACANALADRPLLDVRALDGDVLADRARLDVDGIEVLLGDEQHLALRWIRVRAALQPSTGDRPAAFVRVGPSTLPGR